MSTTALDALDAAQNRLTRLLLAEAHDVAAIIEAADRVQRMERQAENQTNAPICCPHESGSGENRRSCRRWSIRAILQLATRPSFRRCARPARSGNAGML
jgi:hypothetical protein